MEKWLRFYQFLLDNKRVLGLVLGTIFGVLYLIFGFFKTLVFLFFVAIGYWVGRMWDNREDWRDVLDRIMPPKYRE